MKMKDDDDDEDDGRRRPRAARSAHRRASLARESTAAWLRRVAEHLRWEREQVEPTNATDSLGVLARGVPPGHQCH